MIAYFKCLTTGRVFSDAESSWREEHDSSEAWGQRCYHVFRYRLCPCCNTENFRDYAACAMCIEADEPQPREALDGSDDCLECAKQYDPEAYAEFVLAELGR